MKKKPLTLSLPEILTRSQGDLREKTLRELGLSGDDVRFVVKLLDERGITTLTRENGARRHRKLACGLPAATQLVLEIPFETLYKSWREQKNTHSRKQLGRRLPSVEQVRISGDQFYHGAVFPAIQVLTPPEKMFTKEELQRGEGYGEFDTGATATVIETGEVYVYNGFRWVKQPAAG